MSVSVRCLISGQKTGSGSGSLRTIDADESQRSREPPTESGGENCHGPVLLPCGVETCAPLGAANSDRLVGRLHLKCVCASTRPVCVLLRSSLLSVAYGSGATAARSCCPSGVGGCGRGLDCVLVGRVERRLCCECDEGSDIRNRGRGPRLIVF